MGLDWERSSSLYGVVCVILSSQQQLPRDAFCSIASLSLQRCLCYDVFLLSSMGTGGLDEIKSMLK